MQAYDVFMLTVLVAAIAWGAWKGLAWQVASIASILVSYFVAVNFRAPVAKMFNYDPPEWNNFLAMLVLYVGTTLVIWVAFNIVRDFLERVHLKEFDRQIGGAVGAAKGILICTIITLFTLGLGTESQRQAVVSSRSGYYIARLLEKVAPLVPAEYQPQLQGTIAHLEQRHGVAEGTYQQGIELPFNWWGQRRTSAPAWQQPAPGGWGATTGSQAGSAGELGRWVTPENVNRFQREVLPRLEQEQSRLQGEIDQFAPPPTGR
jgi:membrane protein required for colicin V production